MRKDTFNAPGIALIFAVLVAACSLTGPGRGERHRDDRKRRAPEGPRGPRDKTRALERMIASGVSEGHAPIIDARIRSFQFRAHSVPVRPAVSRRQDRAAPRHGGAKKRGRVPEGPAPRGGAIGTGRGVPTARRRESPLEARHPNSPSISRLDVTTAQSRVQPGGVLKDNGALRRASPQPLPASRRSRTSLAGG